MYAHPTIYARRASKPTGSPAMSGMVFSLLFLAREPFAICLRRLLRRPRQTAVERVARSLSLSLTEIRAVVLGRHQDHVTDLFGQPRTRMQSKCPIWYYSIDARQQIAMAITFHDQCAVLVEFFQLP